MAVGRKIRTSSARVDVTTQFRAHYGCEPGAGAVADAGGRLGRPGYVRDTLSLIRARGEIDDHALICGRDFQAAFGGVESASLSAFDPARIRVDGRGADSTGYSDDVTAYAALLRERMWALGEAVPAPLVWPTRCVAWHVIGAGWSLRSLADLYASLRRRNVGATASYMTRLAALSCCVWAGQPVGEKIAEIRQGG